jgi:hypothetical protein
LLLVRMYVSTARLGFHSTGRIQGRLCPGPPEGPRTRVVDGSQIEPILRSSHVE